MEKIVLKPYVESMIADMDTPISLYKKYVGDEIGFLLESNDTTKGRYSFISKNPFKIMQNLGNEILIDDIKMEREKPFLDYVKAEMAKIKLVNPDKIPFAGGAFGSIAYDIIRQYENLPNVNPDDINIPESHLFFIKEGIIYDHHHQKIIFMALDEDHKDGEKRALDKISELKNLILNNDIKERVVSVKINGDIKSNTGKEEYMRMVEKAKEYIHEGDIFQVVLSQRWEVESKENPFNVYRQLRAINPSPYLFFFNFGDYHVAGSSPELLVELKDNKIFTCPIAGTRKRGANAKEDIELAEDLLGDHKETAEHVMLVDLARNDMGRVAKIGTVAVEEFMKVQYYSHVMHITSLVVGEKDEKDDCFSILSSFLPAGTLSGAPKIRAMEIIDELEKNKRGIYGGSVGYFSFDGNMDTCIAIRTMVMKDEKIYMQAGAGLTAHSDPLTEYEECQNKVKALIKALGGKNDFIN